MENAGDFRYDERVTSPLRRVYLHGAPIRALAFSPHGVLAAADAHGAISLYSAADTDDDEARAFPVDAHRQAVSGLSFLDESTLATACDDMGVRLLAIPSLAARVLKGHMAEVDGVLAIPESLRSLACLARVGFVSWSKDGTVRGFDTELLRPAWALRRHHLRWGARRVAITPDGQIHTADGDGRIRSFDLATPDVDGAPALVGEARYAASALEIVAASRGATWLLAPEEGALLVCRWSAVPSVEVIASLDLRHAVACGNNLVAAAADGALYRFTLDGAQPASDVLGEVAAPLTLLVALGEGRCLAASTDGRCFLIDVDRGRIAEHLADFGTATCAAFSASAGLVALGHESGAVALATLGDLLTAPHAPRGQALTRVASSRIEAGAFAFDVAADDTSFFLGMRGTERDVDPHSRIERRAFEDGRLLAAFPQGEAYGYHDAFVLLPAVRRVLALGAAATWLLDADTLRPVTRLAIATAYPHQPAVVGDRLAIPSGDTIVVISARDGAVERQLRWPGAKGEQILFSVGEHPDHVAAVTNARTLVWNLATGEQLAEGERQGSQKYLRAVDHTRAERYAAEDQAQIEAAREIGVRAWDRAIASPDGRFLVLESDNHGFVVWDVEAHRSRWRSRIHGRGPIAARFLSRSPRLVTWQPMIGDGEDHNVYLWDLERGDLLLAARGHHQVLLSRDERVLITAANPSGKGACWIWATDLDRLERLGRIDGHTNYLRPIALSPSGDWIASACNGGLVQVHGIEKTR